MIKRAAILGLSLFILASPASAGGYTGNAVWKCVAFALQAPRDSAAYRDVNKLMKVALKEKSEDYEADFPALVGRNPDFWRGFTLAISLADAPRQIFKQFPRPEDASQDDYAQMAEEIYNERNCSVFLP